MVLSWTQHKEVLLQPLLEGIPKLSYPNFSITIWGGQDLLFLCSEMLTRLYAAAESESCPCIQSDGAANKQSKLAVGTNSKQICDLERLSREGGKER